WPWPRAKGNPVHRHKSLSYAENMAARRMAAGAGAFDALFTNLRGHVAEGTATNVFLVERGRLVTPPLDEGLLPGVTRKHLLAIAARIGVGVRERPFGVARLCAADEAFVANSLAEVVPVSRVEGRRIAPPGPLTRTLAQAYHAEVLAAIEEGR
ncbi:MAG: aminotransferase class IV, partial [Planctomycetota bacterium]